MDLEAGARDAILTCIYFPSDIVVLTGQCQSVICTIL